MEDVIHIWIECGLIRSWNKSKLNIQRKVKTQKVYYKYINTVS